MRVQPLIIVILCVSLGIISSAIYKQMNPSPVFDNEFWYKEGVEFGWSSAMDELGVDPATSDSLYQKTFSEW